ncbi:tetratricopeptide repeat protein [Endozoicomonas sp. G2_1]|uniref:tetratricopeptide repeat protein n=1 Tax=Endozoicomonas sp. G2_1 TaxID=2821091 RepID=UPI001ADD38C9|nr:tetratricopeptide repeat protein [Endozoicomonas sp. G2_1]MBO9488842.1 tetratricopeptide repeat protein [Endozoicomonas sp. G2_1]
MNYFSCLKGIQNTVLSSRNALSVVFGTVVLLASGCSQLKQSKPVAANDSALTSAASTSAPMTNAPSALPEQKSEYLVAKEQALANTSAEVQARYKAGVEAMESQQWQLAEQIFTELVLSESRITEVSAGQGDLAPSFAGAYLNLAIIAEQQGDPQRAQAYVNQALKANPLNPYAHNFNGVLARQRGDFALAQKSYQQALSSMPNYQQAHLNLAILAELYQGDFVLAKQHYQAYLAIVSDDKKVQRWLAVLELKLDKLANKSNGRL